MAAFSSARLSDSWLKIGEFLRSENYYISGSPVYVCMHSFPVGSGIVWLPWKLVIALLSLPTDLIGKIIWPKQHNINLVWPNACSTVLMLLGISAVLTKENKT